MDAVRFGDLPRFLRIEAATQGWWFPTLDRGAGALLHFAVDHGQLEMVKFLVERRGVEVNQRDAARGWTPLHRCARVAHYHHAPFLGTFEYLLSAGADPEIVTFQSGGGVGAGCGVLDLAVKKVRAAVAPLSLSEVQFCFTSSLLCAIPRAGTRLGRGRGQEDPGRPDSKVQGHPKEARVCVRRLSRR